MENYINQLLSQIRCKKAWQCIEDEIRGHIEEQTEENIKQGMSREEAEQKAVLDMGDPIEVGISMDRIHRPKIAWGMIGLIVLISIVGVIIHQMIGYRAAQDTKAVYYSLTYPSGVLMGLLVMFGICFVDYTTIAKYARLIAAMMLGIALCTAWFAPRINGQAYYVGTGSLRIAISAFLMFYVPVYGGVLYSYHKTGYRGFLKSVIWMLLPVWILIRACSLFVACILFTAMFIQLTIAVVDGWFLVAKKKVIIGMWAVGVLMPVIGTVTMFLGHMLADYQMARIRAFLTKSGDASYLTNLLTSQLKASTWIGGNGNDMLGLVPEINSDYIFTYITGSYGILAGLFVCALMAVLIVLVFQTAVKQKNRVGMMMGCGCGMVFTLNIVINILENLGLLPLSQTFLPFLSAGRSNLVLCYALMGIMLSIYRYKDVYQRDVDEKRRSRSWRIPI